MICMLARMKCLSSSVAVAVAVEKLDAAAMMAMLKNALGSSKDSRNENDLDKNSNSESLFTSEGLQPSYSDLTKIFDNSDDNSNDDHVSLMSLSIHYTRD